MFELDYLMSIFCLRDVRLLVFIVLIRLLVILLVYITIGWNYIQYDYFINY